MAVQDEEAVLFQRWDETAFDAALIHGYRIRLDRHSRNLIVLTARLERREAVCCEVMMRGYGTLRAPARVPKLPVTTAESQ